MAERIGRNNVATDGRLIATLNMNKYTSKILGAAALALFALSCQQSANTGTDANNTAVVRADTLAYTTERYQQASEHIVSTTEVTDTTLFQAAYPVFNEPALDEIIRYALTNSDTASVETTAAAFIAEYDELVSSSDYAHPWFSQHLIAVHQNTPSYVCLASDAQSYTGGAHGSYYTRYIHYDAQEQKEIVLTDWVRPERLNELAAIAERFFRADEGLAPNQSLDSYFFENSRFSLPDNFYLANGKLHFLYNIYEIKAYSEGQTTLSIPFAEVAHLMSDRAKQAYAEITDKENLSRQ